MEIDIKVLWKNGIVFSGDIIINKEWVEMFEKENFLKWEFFSEDSEKMKWKFY